MNLTNTCQVNVSADLKSCMIQLDEVKRALLERELIISHMEETIVRDLLFSFP